MKHHTWRRVLVLAGVLIFACGCVFGKEDVASALKNLIIQNMKASQIEDMNAMLQTIHSQSPVYMATKQQMVAIFENYDMKYDLVSFKYIGMDGDYAVARTKQKTTRVSGPAFQNKVIDVIAIFRKENGQWKFWYQVILEINYIN